MAVLDQERVNLIKQILKWHPRGMTISNLTTKMKLNRNLVAKYLDMLLISGQVEMMTVGVAKVYFLSQRVPVSAMMEFSSDLIIMIDHNGKILQVNEQILVLLDEKRESLLGKRIDEIGNPFIHDLPITPEGKDSGGGKEIVIEKTYLICDEKFHFRYKRVPTAFEDGNHGFTFIIENITPQKKYQEMLEISEARYRGIVRSSGEAIIGTTEEGMIASWNPSAERLYGYTESEAATKTLSMLVPEENSGNIDALLKKIAQGDCIQRREIKMKRKDGSIIDVMITICPIKGENGAIVGASSIVRDITSEKVEQHIREQEDRYRTLVEDLKVGIYRSTGDPKGRFVWGNTALLQILGYQNITDLHGIEVADVFSEPDGRKELLEELYRTGFVKNRVLNLKKKDSTPITVSVTALAEFDEKKNIVFINGIVQDITGFANPQGSLLTH
jgi:PAS domain S-box-containing protein